MGSGRTRSWFRPDPRLADDGGFVISMFAFSESTAIGTGAAIVAGSASPAFSIEREAGVRGMSSASYQPGQVVTSRCHWGRHPALRR